MFRLDHTSVLCMFSCESDLNTSIVFSIPSFRAFELTRGKTDFSFLSFEYSNSLLQGILWSDYDTNQYNPSSSILLYHFESTACFFLSNIIPVFHSDIRDVRGNTTTQLQQNFCYNCRSYLWQNYGRHLQRNKDLPEAVACGIHLSDLRILRAAYFYDLVRKQDPTGLRL